MSFEKFTSRITIRGRLIAQTGLHIGTGGTSIDPSATDGPVIRDAAGRPFIPGSSLKGAIRAHLESLTRGLNSKKIWSCDPLAEPCIPDKKSNGSDGIKEIKEDAEKSATKNRQLDQAKYDRLVTDEIDGRSCSVCKLFGSPWLASHAMVKDAFVIPELWARRIELRDGVGIDRDTETARQGVKYDFEVVPATTGFAIEIVVENAGEDQLGLLALALREMEDGRIAVGGKTTRGLGGVRLVLNDIEVVGDSEANKFTGEGSTGVLDYLINRKGRMLKGDSEGKGPLHEYLDSKITALVSAGS